MDSVKLDQLKEEYPELAPKLDELVKTNGVLEVVPTECGDAVFRRPKPAEFERYLSMIFDDKSRPKGNKMLALACVVHPSRDVFATWLDECPGIPLACADELNKLAGVSRRERGKD